MSTEQVYHYVYRITNTVENKHYYGKRSSKVLPILDIGVKYFSSSTDKTFIRDQKENPQNYRYKIVSTHTSATSAIEKEIRLHAKFNVANSSKFYNKAAQTSKGFSTCGTNVSTTVKAIISAKVKTYSNLPEVKAKTSKLAKERMAIPESREKLSKIVKELWQSPEHRASRVAAMKAANTPDVIAKRAASLTGRKHSEETKLKMSIIAKARTESAEIRNMLSERATGRKVNIYSNSSGELLAENVSLGKYAKDNNYHPYHLGKTAKADRSLPNSNKNPHQHKGIYARYVDPAPLL